jgi:hypothetical protein
MTPCAEADKKETPEPPAKANIKAVATVDTDDTGDSDDDESYCTCGKKSRSDGNDTLLGCDG